MYLLILIVSSPLCVVHIRCHLILIQMYTHLYLSAGLHVAKYVHILITHVSLFTYIYIYILYNSEAHSRNSSLFVVLCIAFTPASCMPFPPPFAQFTFPFN